jgi:hypothetical protein
VAVEIVPHNTGWIPVFICVLRGSKDVCKSKVTIAISVKNGVGGKFRSIVSRARICAGF